MDVTPVRLAVVGSGFGAAVATPVFAGLPGVRVTAVLARRLEKARQIADQYDIEHHAADFKALQDLPVDAVYIALPPAVSGQAVLLAQRRGLHILAEKPLTSCATEMADIAGRLASRVQMVNYGFPELPAWQHLHALLHHNIHGNVRFVNVRWLVHSYAEQHGLRNWKRNRLQGGGVLPLLGNHLFHYLEWLFGPLAALQAMRHPADAAEAVTSDFAPADRGVSLQAVTAQGIPITAVLSNAAPGATVHQVEVVCDRATIRLTNRGTDYMREFTCAVTGAGATAIRRFQLIDARDARRAAFHSLASRFFAAIRHGWPARPDFGDDLRAHALVCATGAAVTTGALQTLDPSTILRRAA